MKFFFCTLFISFSLLVEAQNNDSTISTRQKDTVNQQDIIDYASRFLKIKSNDYKRDNRKFRFLLFPSEINNSNGGLLLTSFSSTFYLADRKTTNLSTVYFIPYISINWQYGTKLQSNLWLKNNTWNFLGDYFFLKYPQNTWGLGGNSTKDSLVLIDYNAIRFHQTVMRKVFPHFEIGLGYWLDYHYLINFPNVDSSSYINRYFPNQKKRTTTSGLTLPVVYDTRKSSINPQQGYYIALTYGFFSKNFGGDSNWQSLFADFRKYFNLNNKLHDVIAFRSYYWTVLNGNVPYLDLPSNNWEPVTGTASRGTEQNRYRSNAILYFESEYRFGISANGMLGGVVFVNVLSASKYKTQEFHYWKPATGFGVRLKLNKYSNTNMRFDLGFSKDYFTYYISVGESF